MQLARQKLQLACEITGDCVIAAHAANGLVDLTSVRVAGAGAVVPSLTATNIIHRDAVRTAVQEAVAAVAGRTRDLIAVIPDGACRIALLEFDGLPLKREEADAVVRFRLKKSLPFDVDHSRVSYQAQAPKNDKISVIAAVVLHSVLEEYETVLHEAGYGAGVVVPSLIAALGQVESAVPTLVIKTDQLTTSVAILDGERMVLLRTLDNPTDTRLEPAQLAEDVYPSLVFYQDTYGRMVETILVGGAAASEQLHASLAELTGIRAQELVSSSRLAASATAHRAMLGGVTGALTG